MQPIPSPIILANGEIRDAIITNGADMLRRGASAADVAEQIARDVEDDPNEHTVGYGGWPNILGEVELDASFMDGATLHAGAVAALRGFRHPISVARQVMERLPHVLMAGEGAARFADEIGAERRDMLSPEARQGWLDHLSKLGLYDTLFRASNSLPDVKTQLTNRVPDLIGLVHRATSWKEGSDTMNVIVRDADGHICSAVSTSGIAWKYPGRVGDSPVIGAGNYADNRAGAAACMGWGEVTIRTGAARLAVMHMHMGQSMDEAGRAVLREMSPLCNDGQWVRILLMDAHGSTGGFATQAGLNYKVQTLADAAPHLCEAITMPF
jgi:beta-aspartyl-peptidase (threonine type)